MKRAALLGAGVLALACAHGAHAQRMDKDAAWSLRLPQEARVTYRGATTTWEGTAGAFPGLYPAPNLVGLLAAVVTHAVVADSAQSQQRRQLQENADRVLTGYRPVLETFEHQELMRRGLEKVSTGGGARKLVATNEKPAGDWLIESGPMFSLTQDERAIVLDNAIAIYAPGSAETPVYRNAIRVVSRPQEREDLLAYWTAEQGAALKEESATLFALSLDIALTAASAAAPSEAAVQRTFRYAEGKTERMERAELVSEHCNRVVIRNLRGWLMSIPAPQSTGACGADARKP